MNIAVVVALLIMLIAHIGKKNKPAQPAPKKAERGDHDWIDELEVLDAIMDDFI